MKALVKYARGYGNAEIREVERPKPGFGEAVVRVCFAGLCGSDIHAYKDDGSYRANPPITMGHEFSGIVEELGEGCSAELLGKRVVGETYFYTCGTCRYCKSGHANLCESRLSIGTGKPGCFAEYLLLPAKNLHVIPDSLELKDAAIVEPLVCVVHAAMEKGEVQAGDNVVITGPGPIGLLLLQVLKICGCNVMMLGIDRDREKLELAKKLGADYIGLSSNDEETVKSIKETFGGGADITFDCAGVEGAVNLLLDVLRKGGRHVQVALFGKPVTLQRFNDIYERELELRGSFAQKSVWWDRAIRFIEKYGIDFNSVISGVYPLDEWEKAFNDAMSGDKMKLVLKITD